MILFLFEFIKKLNFTELLKIFLVSIIISIPEIIYLSYLIFNLDFITFLSSRADGNYLENSIIIFSIMFFYLLPFLYGNLKNILRFYYKNYIKLIFFFIFNLCLFIIDQFFYDFLNIESNLGGGVILKLLIILNLNYEIFLLFIFYISLLTFDYFFKGNRIKNYGLFLILILCFPMPVIYQKYLDPLFIIIFFGLVQSDNLRKIIQEKSVSLLSLYVYFTLFLFFSLNYYM